MCVRACVCVACLERQERDGEEFERLQADKARLHAESEARKAEMSGQAARAEEAMAKASAPGSWHCVVSWVVSLAALGCASAACM